MKLNKISSQGKKEKSVSQPIFKGKKSDSILRKLKEKEKEKEKYQQQSNAEIKRKDSPAPKAQEIQLLKTQLEEVKKDYLYLKADFENYKKNVFKEKSDLIKYGGQSLVSSLAEEVLDDFERAFQSFTQTQSLEGFKDGMGFVHAKFSKILNRFGVVVMDPTGQPFDPQYHEALSRQQSDEVPEGHIIVTLKKAYKLYDRLIRPAQVIVSTGKTNSSSLKDSKESMNRGKRGFFKPSSETDK